MGKMLYKFLSDDVALKVLAERQLKVSLISELNDVYDCLPVIETVGDNWNEESKKRARMILTKIETCYGLLCFSRNYRSPIQWGHYAAGGTGIALGFDTRNPAWGEPIEVEYEEQRPVLRFSSLDEVWKRDELELTRAVAKVKSQEWVYENEVRFLYKLSDCEPQSGMYFKGFVGNDLRHVIVGSRCKKKLYVKRFLEKHYKGLRASLYMADIDESRFDLQIVQFDSLLPVDLC